MNIKIERLNTLFVEEISKIIHNEIADKNIDFVTVTDAKVSTDLSYLKVYITSLDENRDKVLKSLNKASGYIRSKLCERIQLRKMPELHFVYDTSIEYSNKIEEIIEKINDGK